MRLYVSNRPAGPYLMGQRRVTLRRDPSTSLLWWMFIGCWYVPVKWMLIGMWWFCLVVWRGGVWLYRRLRGSVAPTSAGRHA